MNGKDLAVALVSGGRSEPEKFRLINEAFSPSRSKALTPDEVAHVQGCLRKDRRLARLSLKFADAARDADFATAELFSANTVTPGHVAIRFDWLYTTERLANETFLANELMKLSYSVRLKVLYAIGSHVADVQLGDRLWELVRTKYSLRLSNRLLAACSNDLIIREMTAYSATKITDAQMLQIVKKRFASAVELLHELLLLRKDNKLKQSLCFENALHFVLLKDLDRGFCILVETNTKLKLGANRTRALLRALSNGGDSALKERVVNYSENFHLSTLKKYASTEVYLECFLRGNMDFDPSCWLSPITVQAWLTDFSQSDTRRCLDALYQQKYKTVMLEVPTKIPPEFLHVLGEDEWCAIVNDRLKKNDYSFTRIAPNYGLHFWTAMLPCRLAFPDLKQLLSNEPCPEARGIIYQLMISSAVMQRNGKALEQQFKYVVERSRNDVPKVQDKIVETLSEYFKYGAPVKANIWSTLREFYEVLILERKCHHESNEKVLFRALKAVGSKDKAGFKDVAIAIAKYHLFQHSAGPRSYTSRVKHLKKQDVKNFLQIVLEHQEPYLEEKRKSAYSDTNGVFRIFRTACHQDVEIDFTQYPNALSFLKYIVSPGKKAQCFMNERETFDMAYKLVKAFLSPEDPVKTAMAPPADWTSQVKAIIQDIIRGNRVSEVNLDIVLNRQNGVPVSVLCRLGQHLAATDGISSEFLQMVINFCSDEKHRLAAIRLLATCMPLDQFRKQFNSTLPKKAKIDHKSIDRNLYDTQVALIKSIKLLGDSVTALEMISSYMQGDYLKSAVGVFNYFCARSPPGIVLPIASEKLGNCPVSVEKHYLRWFLLLATDSEDKIIELINSAKHGSIKRELLRIVYEKVEHNGEKAWPVLEACLKTIRPEDKQTFKYIFSNRSIDHRLDKHLSDFFDIIMTLARNLNVQGRSQVYDVFGREAGYLARLSQDFAEKTCTLALQENLSLSGGLFKPREYVARFVMHNVPKNFKFFSEQFATSMSKDPEFAKANLGRLTYNMCKEAISAKRSRGQDCAVVLEMLAELLSGHIDWFFEQKVYVELHLILLELLPAGQEGKEDMASIARAFSQRGVALLCERLDQYGAQMFGLLNPLLLTTFRVLNDKPTYCARMIETYTKESPSRHAWFLIECLPYRDSDNKRDQDAYNGFIRAVLEGSDIAAKILLKVKKRAFFKGV